MEKLTNERVLEKLKSKFDDSVITGSDEQYGMLAVDIKRDHILEVLKYLKEDEELGFLFLTDLTGIHYPEPDDKLGVIYHLHNLVKNIRIRIRSFFPKTEPAIDSATAYWKAANWMERETYDFFGIVFKNHPNLKRILNVDDMDYFPLRKEYALEDASRTDKDDSMFGR